MRTVTVALVAFTCGALSMLLFEIAIPSRLALAQDPRGWFMAVPKVPPLSGRRADHETYINSGYRLDGLETTNGTFNQVTFVYGGGAYKLEGSTIVGPTTLKLIGAAANTAQLLGRFGLLAQSPLITSAPDTGLNTPIVQKTTKTTIKGDFVSPYNGEK